MIWSFRTKPKSNGAYEAVFGWTVGDGFNDIYELSLFEEM
jgi:hypothetical protein